MLDYCLFIFMQELVDFEIFEGKYFDVYIGEEKVEKVHLLRTGKLPNKAGSGYPWVRKDPFELLFRASSDKMINQVVKLVAPNEVECEIFLHPGCCHVDEVTGSRVTQYHCLFA